MNEVDIFRTAISITERVQRSAFLDRACAGDAVLRERVEAMLTDHDSPRDRNPEPAVTSAAGPEVVPGNPPAVSAASAARQIGAYKLLQQIGEGGMGIVYLAEQQQPIRRRVALKIIKPGMDSAQVIARFEAERQALAMMDHQNIARVLDAGATESGRPYFVMELVPGVPITRYCDDNQLSLRQRLEVFVPACRAIQHAHQKGIIHRDIKPSNVLITLYDGRPAPKVIDFGIAKATEQRLTERTMFTQYGAVVGTVEYMSPEQAEMSALGVDTRSDIYSLGVLLYELLTGTTPLERQRLRDLGFAEMVRLIKEEEPPQPSTRLSDTGKLAAIAAQRKAEPAALAKFIRGDLDWIVMKCLEKDRTRRYDSASALARDLERFLNDEPVEARPPSAGYRFSKFARKHSAALAAATAFAALVVAGASVSTWQALRATQAELATRDERDRAKAAERRANEARDNAQAAEQREKDARSRAEAAEEQAKADRDRALAAEQKAKQDRDSAVKSEAAAQDAAKRAEVEAATAKAVTDFLQQDILGRSNPANEPNRDIKLREVLDRAAQTIGGRFERQPLVEAAIRETIGGAYMSLGAYQEAIRQFSAAEELRRRESGENDPWVALDKFEIAAAYRWLGRSADAERVYLESLEISRKTLGNEHRMTIATLSGLGGAYSLQGKFDDAERVFTGALDTARRVFDTRNPLLHEVIHNFGGMYMENRQYAKALPLATEAHELHREVLGEEHPDTIASMGNLAIIYLELGRLDEAEPLFARALELSRRIHGEEHIMTISAMTCMGKLIHMRGNEAEAERLLGEAIELSERALGEEHPFTITALYQLAFVYAAQEKYEQAVPLYVKVLELRRRVQGSEHPLTLVVLYSLGYAYQQLQRYDEAEPLLEELLANRRGDLAAIEPNLFDVFSRLATNRLKQGRFVDAEKLLREYLAVLEKAEPDAWRRFAAESMLAEALAGQGKRSEAEPMLLAAYEELRKHAEKNPGAADATSLRAAQRLVELYDAWGDQAGAEKWRKQAESFRPR